MILNVSGRCDIVGFYTEWFLKRYQDGYVDVRNPFYPKQVSRIYFDDVDGIVFCTKNPLPIIPYLDKIEKPILFHITLTPYKKDIEPGVPSKDKIIEGIKEISNIIGSENTYVRYDPILLNDKYSLDYHIKAFNRVCELLDGYIKHIIISFVDDYKNVRNNQKELNLKPITKEDMIETGKYFGSTAKTHGMTVQTCYEEENLVEYGFIKRDCVDRNLAFRLTGKTNFKKWKSRGCDCIEMVDIGVYNSCSHFCRYCYANYDEKQVIKNRQKHNPDSSLLIGELEKDDIIKVRRS